MKLSYDHPAQKFVVLSAPEPHFHQYKTWLDFALTHFPSQNSLSVCVRFHKKDYCGSDLGTRGIFKCVYDGVGEISVCVGKNTQREEEEIREVFFHEYGHFLQFDQNRFYHVPSAELEADADAFAEIAVARWLTTIRSATSRNAPSFANALRTNRRL